MKDPAEKWQSEQVAASYSRERFAGERARTRDQGLIEGLLARHAPGQLKALLDAPCGTGRLRPALSSHAELYVGVDISRAMLAELGAPAVLGDALALPMQSASYDVVISCRLLHHLDSERQLARVAAELVRVSRGLVIASFWDSTSWPGLRRARGWRRDTTGRRAVSRGVIEAAFTNAGAEVIDYAASCRFVSMQTFFAARKV